jgi:formate dehydrogenase maturation protein FdhE
LKTVAAYAPETLAAEAQELLQASNEVTDEMLITYWFSPSDIQFFAKAFLQPYGRWLAEAGDVRRQESERRCPFCGGKPQVSFLQSKESNAESGNRDLICATCLSTWEFRRVVCANCGEDIKGVDLTRLGLAVPLVDEVAAAPLDVWAREHGYTKIELNLIGL